MIWMTDRNRQQGELVSEFLRAADAVPREHSAVIAGGLPGAAKDDALDQHGVDRSRYLTISIDAVLAELAARGLIPAVEGRSPLGAADLVHTEAQHVAKRIGLVALNDGRNVLLDLSLASRPATSTGKIMRRKLAEAAQTAMGG